MREVLRLCGVGLTYQAANGEIEALRGIDLTAYEGELIAIVGPSGSGKSTLLTLVAGLIKPSKGDVFLLGERVNGVSDRIGYMLQRDNLLEWRTIRRNVTLGLEIRGLMSRDFLDYAEHLLDTYKLGDFMDNYPAQLSGGMRQRAALIRTLATKPDLLLLDEAFSALDFQTRLHVTDDVFQILKKEGKTALIVTHDIQEGLSLADRVVVLGERPGTVRAVHRLDYPPDAGQDYMLPFERRNQPQFGRYFNLIWKELESNG